jgi:hypothetical protein
MISAIPYRISRLGQCVAGVNALLQRCRELTPLDSATLKITNGPDGWTGRAATPAAGGYPWDKVLFGYSIDGSTITILQGEIHYGKLIVTNAQTDVVIAANNTYVSVKMDWQSPQPSLIVSGTAKPQNDETFFFKWLYKVEWNAASGIRGIASYGHTGGAISLPGAFAG